jgi:ribose-phosphate pyrophosphokinase
MILFSFSNYGHIARQLQDTSFLQRGQFTVARYDNQELHATVQGPVSKEHCLILGSIAPPDEQVLSLMLLAHTLKKEGAGKVTAILPYLAYSRQDKDKPGESLAAAWIGALLKSSGIDQVLTVDVHSERDKQLFPLPLLSLSTAEVFAAAMEKHHLTDATIVAPDNGAISRCEEVKSAAGMPAGDTPYFEKKRTEKGIIHHGPIGRVGPRVVIIDDMLDTGGTLVSACEQLTAAKVEEIYILVTHGLFTGSDWGKLWSLRVKRIFCTDTVSLRADIDAKNITILPVAPLFQEKLLFLGDEGTRRLTARG